jgi:NTE family protein
MPHFFLWRYITLMSLLALLSSCAQYTRIHNKALPRQSAGVMMKSVTEARAIVHGDIALVLAFSGGGTRAAAFSYGVLKELRDTKIVENGTQQSLLDEVDLINSVSGGSFTAAYYGIHREKTFRHFERDFLKRDFQNELISRILNPLYWFKSLANGFDRTELAVEYYDKELFHGATLGDFRNEKGPIIAIHATDIGTGERFTFIPDFFRLICSDWEKFPVARAVTASSAVPIAFAPVTLENFSDRCHDEVPDWLQQAKDDRDWQRRDMARAVLSYKNTDEREYIHLVDGGITDNLGLRATQEFIEMSGDVRRAIRRPDNKPFRHLVIISVNSATRPSPQFEKSAEEPPLAAVADASTSSMMRRYNNDTLQGMHESVKQWAQGLSTPEHPVQGHLIEVNFEQVKSMETRRVLNHIPTSLGLPEPEIELLTEQGRELLRNSPEFQKLLQQLRDGKDLVQSQ